VREFTGPDEKVFRPGQQVDAGNWRNLPNLIRARYLRDRTATEVLREQPHTRPIRGKG
jgi:hypothetical protein